MTFHGVTEYSWAAGRCWRGVSLLTYRNVIDSKQHSRAPTRIDITKDLSISCNSHLRGEKRAGSRCVRAFRSSDGWTNWFLRRSMKRSEAEGHVCGRQSRMSPRHATSRCCPFRSHFCFLHFVPSDASNSLGEKKMFSLKESLPLAFADVNGSAEEGRRHKDCLIAVWYHSKKNYKRNRKGTDWKATTTPLKRDSQ